MKIIFSLWKVLKFSLFEESIGQVLNERYGWSMLSSPAGQMSKTNCWENTSNLNVFFRIIYGLFFLSPSARFNKIYTSTEWLLFYQDVFRWNITSMSNLALSFSFHTLISEGIIKLEDCRLDRTQTWVPKACTCPNVHVLVGRKPSVTASLSLTISPELPAFLHTKSF